MEVDVYINYESKGESKGSLMHMTDSCLYIYDFIIYRTDDKVIIGFPGGEEKLFCAKEKVTEIIMKEFTELEQKHNNETAITS